jgi:hypothetical protein
MWKIPAIRAFFSVFVRKWRKRIVAEKVLPNTVRVYF